MHFLQAINSDLSVLIVCNKTGGTIKGDIKKMYPPIYDRLWLIVVYLCLTIIISFSFRNISTDSVHRLLVLRLLPSGL